MTSFLQQQLLKLSAPQTNIYNEKHKKQSILFDASESKSYNRDDYFDIGKSGFDALVKVDGQFAKYSHLFSKESKNVQRFVADVESNKALDEALEGFLLLLSPYYMKLVPAMKAMEWLLQRYCVNEMNVDAVMMCILPYYDTLNFLKTFKVLDIDQVGKSGEQNKWQWLRKVKQSGQVLVSSIFYDRWQHSAAFRQFCNSYIIKMLKIYDREDGCMPAINFYVTVVMGGLSLIGNRHKKTKELLASDDHVYCVVRVLHILVKSPFEELVSGAYLILMQLAVTVQLQPQLWNEIITLLIKTARPSLCHNLCHCLVIIVHQQCIVQLSPAVLQVLQQPSCPVLEQLTEDHRDSRKVAAWLVAYAGGHIKWCADRHAQDPAALQEHLLQMVSHVTQFMLQPLEAYAVIRNTVESVVRCSAELSSSELSQWLPALLEKLELAFPEAYDRAVRFFTAAMSTADGDKFKEVHALLDQSSSRQLAQSLAQSNTLESVVVSQAGAAASVQAMGVARQALKDAVQQQRPGDQQRTMALAHDLLDKSIQAVRLYPVAKSLKSKSIRRDGSVSDAAWWVRLAAVEGRIAWDAVQEAAKACLPLLSTMDTSEYTLKDDFAEATPEQLSLLLAIKLLRLLIFKQNKASSLLDRVLKCLGDERQQLRLLSLVWGWQPHLPHYHLMEPAVQLWCLQKALSMAQSSSPSEADDSLVAWMVSAHEQVVPSLLSALTACHDDLDDQTRIREAASALVSHLWEAKGTSLRQANFKAVLGLLAENAAGICVDSKTDHLLGAVYQKCSQQPSLLRTLVSAAALSSQPAHLAGVILFSLSQLQDKSVFEGMLPSIKEQLQLIEAGSAPGSPNTASTMDSEPSIPYRLEAGPSMLLYWSMVHLNSASVTVLETDLGWEVFTAGLRCSAEALVLEGKMWSPQTVLARQVTNHKLLQSIDSSSLSGRMWSVMATAASGIAVSPRAADRLHRALRDVTLHARFVLDQLQQLQLVTVATSIRAAQQKRMKLEQQKGGRKGRRLSGSFKKGVSSSTKGDHEDTIVPFELPSNWRSLQLLLELLCEVRCVQEPWLLVEPLCTCMHEALVLGLSLAERLIQQVLACLHHLITLAMEIPPEDAELRSVLQVNVESVVQCVRQSADPYTHRWALLVLSLAAKIQPEAVLNNLMTIFTFMGEGLLQRDDKFSFQVIEKTVTSLVPILAQRSKNSEEVCSLVQVFVDALPDIAVHRRLMVFRLLTASLKPQTHLWLVDMLIVKSYIMHGVSRLPDDLVGSSVDQSTGGRRMPREISFALQLTEQFEVKQQVAAARHVLALLTVLPTSVGADHSKNWLPRNVYSAVLGLNQLSAKQLRHFIYTSVGFLGQLFVSENFIATLLPVSESKDDADVEELQAAYEELLTTVSSYLSVVSQQMTDTAADDLLAHKFWSSLQRKLVEVLEAICSLLQPELLLRVICSLLQSSLAPVRLRASDLLRTRLMPSASFFSEEHTFVLVSFMPILQDLGYSDSESDECRQVALSALHLLLRFVAGVVHAPEVMPVLTSSVSLVTQQDAPRVLVMQAVLVSAECVGLMQNETVAVLPQLLPALLSFLDPQQRSPAPEADHLPLSAATAIYKVVDSLPQFLSRYLDSLLVKMCQVSWLQESQAKDSKLCNKLSALAILIREKMDPKILLPALLKAFRELSDCTGELVCSSVGVLELLGELVNTLNGAALSELRPPLLDLLTIALDARQNHRRNTALTAAQIDLLEERAVWAVTRVVLRQDEAANLSLYISLQEWVDKRDSTLSRIAFYRLLEHLASTLQVLFIKARLADQIFGHAIQTLSNTVTISKKNESSKRSASICQLLKHVLGALANIFQYDSVGFTSDARFRQLLEPILQQVCNTVGGLPLYIERVSQHLRPCLLQLCSAARSDALWADLNKKMLTILREDMHPQVHASVLLLTQSLIEELREDWLQPLLLDTLPFVTEALESSHEVVENRARELLAVMTDLMGDAVREQLEV